MIRESPLHCDNCGRILNACPTMEFDPERHLGADGNYHVAKFYVDYQTVVLDLSGWARILFRFKPELIIHRITYPEDRAGLAVVATHPEFPPSPPEPVLFRIPEVEVRIRRDPEEPHDVLSVEFVEVKR